MNDQAMRATAEWLFAKGLLIRDEVAGLTSTNRLPHDFPNRVLSQSRAAAAVSVTEKVHSHRLLVVERFTPPEPPILTYGGPLPREFQFEDFPEYPMMVHEVQNGKMFLGSARSTLILNENQYFLDLSTSNSKWIAPAFWEAPADMHLDGTVAVLFVDGATFFGHWMFDLLPKFHVLRQGWPDEAIDYYVVNATTAGFAAETLACLGIPREKVMCTSGCIVGGNKLLVPSSVRKHFRTPDWAREFIVSLFPSKAADDQYDSAGERIYISRARAKRRRVINEGEVRVFLESRGFQTVFAENMQISEFAEIIRRSGWIVAPHGAGITNVAFARPEVRVLEFFGAHIVPEGWFMTNAVGGKHYLLAGCTQTGGYAYLDPERDSVPKMVRNKADYIVQVGELSCALGLMGLK